jgi:ATP-dependent helicase HrpB
VPPTDSLAGATFVVAADLDGKRDGARIRLGAALDRDDVLAVAGDAVEEHRRIEWDRERDDLVGRVSRTVDRLDLGTTVGRPPPGAETTAALVAHARRSKQAALPMGVAASLRARVAFLRTLDADRWPDLSDAALLRSLDDWLAPFLAGATSKVDVETLDVEAALRVLLPPGAGADLARLAPDTFTLPSGRRVPLDYDDERAPALHARVQDLFGVTTHPTVGGGRVPVVVHLLSPAGRPVQVTSDLPGFWAGSWAAVRKEMAGRYPKHRWPEDPTG